MPEIRDRIVELRRIPAASLRSHAKNWRTHPDAQRTALTAILEEVGYAGALIGRDTPNGVELIDGHLRADATPDAIVPVLIVDLSDEEAELVLATHDPLAAMAGADAKVLDELLTGLTISDNALRSMLESVADDAGLRWPAVDPKPPAPPDPTESNVTFTAEEFKCPHCGGGIILPPGTTGEILAR